MTSIIKRGHVMACDMAKSGGNSTKTQFMPLLGQIWHKIKIDIVYNTYLNKTSPVISPETQPNKVVSFFRLCDVSAHSLTRRDCLFFEFPSVGHAPKAKAHFSKDIQCFKGCRCSKNWSLKGQLNGYPLKKRDER